MNNEIALIKRAQAGDVNAFKELILPYQSKLFNTAFFFVNNEHDASDISQETWLKSFNGICSFRFESSFYTWICKILKNIFIDKYSRKVYKQLEVEIDESIIPADHDNPLQQIEQKQRDEIVRNTVAQLPPEFKTTVILVDMEGLSYEEVAKITKVPVNTVRSRLSRGRERLRKSFSEMGTF